MSKTAVGIDLGTSNSVVAVVREGISTVIPDSEGRTIHPSVISFMPSGETIVGYDAKRRRVIDPSNTVYSAKRMIGQTFRSEAVQAMVKRSAYKIVEGENQQPILELRGKPYGLSELSAIVLRYLKGLAEKHLGEEVTDAVITVPANFNDAQREATRLAGQIAGLNVLRILNEPTAAALAYGFGHTESARIVVYDFGGGTFDVTALQMANPIFEVLSTAGNPFLGGDDIDDAVIARMVQLFLQQHSVDLQYNKTAMARLRSAAELAKCQLSTNTVVPIKIPELAYGNDGKALELNFSLSRDALNAIAREVIQRSFLICDETMSLAKIAPTQIDEVVLVGGTTRMPAVREGVKAYFGRDPRTDINPDEVVAVGAAIQASNLMETGSFNDAVLLDVTPRALGLAVAGGYAETIIERNVQIPIEQKRRFTTGRDDQTQVRIQICQGEDEQFADNQLLGDLVLDGIRPAPRGEVRIEVAFEIDTNGMLQVSAEDLDTGKTQQARLNLLGTMTEEEVAAARQNTEDLPFPF